MNVQQTFRCWPVLKRTRWWRSLDETLGFPPNTFSLNLRFCDLQRLKVLLVGKAEIPPFLLAAQFLRKELLKLSSRKTFFKKYIYSCLRTRLDIQEIF